MVLVPGIFSLVRFGLLPSIDFTGGTVLEISYAGEPELTMEKLTEIWGESYPVVSAQKLDRDKCWLSHHSWVATRNKLRLKRSEPNMSRLTSFVSETIGPTLSKELLMKTITAVILVSVIIMSYVWYRFHELKYGVTAILAMFHDSLILLGSFSLLGHFAHIEVDTLFVTAVLTTLSFSVHDTIVVLIESASFAQSFVEFHFRRLQIPLFWKHSVDQSTTL